MNIHEYQAKTLLKSFGVPVSNGVLIKEDSVGTYTKDIEALNSKLYVVKAQIHAGGRGKGKFKEEKAGDGGGVRLAKSVAEAVEFSQQMLGNVLVTKQTGQAGKKVRQVYIEEASDIDKEFYLSILLDRSKACHSFVVSTQGGMDIEKVAEETPDEIFNIAIDPTTGFLPHHGRRIAGALGVSGSLAKQVQKISAKLYKAYIQRYMSLLEINPLIVTKQNNIHILDAKVSFDENALFRNPEIAELRDPNEEEALEIKAHEFGLSYIKLDGNIGCMVNGAGLAMATMDIIQYYGASPANFLDVGGGATKEKVVEAFKIITSDPAVDGILVNIFGGIMRCDIIAQGIIDATKEIGLTKPLVVRLEGTKVKEGKKLLKEANLAIMSADDLGDAAQKIVNIIKN